MLKQHKEEDQLRGRKGAVRGHITKQVIWELKIRQQAGISETKNTISGKWGSLW